ncbi:PadR family transcriptional regulator [Gemmatimonadota bacterium]
MFKTTLKKGSMEMLVLALLTDQPRHGYDIGKLIELRSGGSLQFNISSLYPVLCRMEKRGWIRGRWVEKQGERRRRFYTLTAGGKKMLAEQREYWLEFIGAVNEIVGVSHV